MDLNNKTVIISRTDSIGDVMLTLPTCHWLKAKFPNVRIVFLGKGYTKPIVEAYSEVDSFEDWATIESNSIDMQVAWMKGLNADVIIHVFPNREIARLAKKVGVQTRIGTSHRLYHRWTCNVRLNFTRKNSELHESQLNHELLRPFGLEKIPTLDEIIRTTTFFKAKDVELPSFLKDIKNVTILHPKSQGSAREWPIEKYMELAEVLTKDGKRIVFTGTEKEGQLFRHLIPANEAIIDSTGRLTLEQLMFFISLATNLVACSTGPLHIAGFSGINAVGLFSPRRPIHPGRWKALGPKVKAIVYDQHCTICNQGKECDCISKIEVETVKEHLI